MHWIYTFVLIWGSSKRQFQSVYHPKTSVFLCENAEIILLYYSSCNNRHPAWNMNYKNCIQSKWSSTYTYFLSYCGYMQYFNANLNIELLLKSQIYNLLQWRLKWLYWKFKLSIFFYKGNFLNTNRTANRNPNSDQIQT